MKEKMTESNVETQRTGFEFSADSVRMRLNIGHLDAEVILSEAEIDALLTTLTKARETLRKAMGKPVIPFGLIAESGTGRPLTPEERKNCVVDIPVSEFLGAQDRVIVHLPEGEDGTKADQS